jgi:predicted NAD/FAD-dependent oxidoreductase
MEHQQTKPVDALVLGAGMAGLAAAHILSKHRRTVRLIDKGHQVGGRVAARRIGASLFDHGLQHFTARHAPFAQQLARWEREGRIAQWADRFPGTDPLENSAPTPHYRVPGGMHHFPMFLAAGMDVLLGCRALAVCHTTDGWLVHLDNGEEVQARALVVTLPAPQAIALMAAGGTALPANIREGLAGIQHARCLTVLAHVDGPTELPPPGAMYVGPEPLTWISDNHAKGVSGVPGAVTLQAGPEYSRHFWELGDDGVAFQLFGCAQKRIGRRLVSYQVKRWRMAYATCTIPETHLATETPFPLVFAGDGMGGSRSEAAWMSGESAGQWMAERIRLP